MQTKQQIERLLAGAGTEPNKRLGQNFLIDLNLMRLLIGAAHIDRRDVVLEIGTGTGSFTEGLAQSGGQVISVEIDRTLFQIATTQLKKYENVRIVNTDILASKSTLCESVVEAVREAIARLGGRMLLVANLPYNVAAPVMMNLIIGGEGGIVADCMCVTVQKEVAERMTASPSTKEYGAISILMAATGHATVMRKLKPSVFWPRPQVDSRMVRFTREAKKVEKIHNLGLFRETVNLFMGHRRKMLQASAKFVTGRL
ncbi:MAG: ribosomal RNA small subunit methyltransferase A, partial [Planctomycetes bacterium]|nr:ribosomal RNA small subunit methyltransferase A [Planctomycetota bacterium]